MDTKRFVIGTLAGGITMYLVGNGRGPRIQPDLGCCLGESLAGRPRHPCGWEPGWCLDDLRWLKDWRNRGFSSLVWRGLHPLRNQERLESHDNHRRPTAREIVRNGIGGAVIAAVLGLFAKRQEGS